ncbi:MAG: hypothetical protein J6J83_08025 [Oscillospiraceae bacterium]|nr:hypothetical protein [Oscillospiraceae bacterium]
MGERLIGIVKGQPPIHIFYDPEKDQFWQGEFSATLSRDPYENKRTLDDEELWLMLVEHGLYNGVERFLELRPKPETHSVPYEALTELELLAQLREVSGKDPYEQYECCYLPSGAAYIVAGTGEIVALIDHAQHISCVVSRGGKHGFLTQEEAYGFALNKVKAHQRAYHEQLRQEKLAEAEAAAPQKRGLFGRRST